MDEAMSRVNRMIISLAEINEWVIERMDINRISFSGVCTATVWIQGIENKVLFINSAGVMQWEAR